MKAALGSDLHNEFGPITLTNDGADVLILSGDIVVAHSQYESMRRKFFKNVSEEFENIVYVAGNHEFYHGHFPTIYDWLRNEVSKYKNIHFLNKESVEIGDYTFVGGTLWTDMNNQDPMTLHLIQNMMNDFRLIKYENRRLQPSDVVFEHLSTVEYIKSVVESDTTKKYVIVGHHAPTKLSINPRYAQDTIMNGGYHSDLSQFIIDHPQIKMWTLGHVHDPHSYYVGETFVVANPRGYIGHDPQAETFKLRYIDLDNLSKFEGVDWSRGDG